MAALVSLKPNVHELDFDKLKTVSVDSSKLKNEVKMKLIKRLCMINWLKLDNYYWS